VLDASMVVPDGRALAYSECGAPGGVPIMYCHGGPGSRLDLVWFDRTFADLGVRVIAADRPGYGGSTPQPGRTWNDWPTDVAALGDHLGLDRFAVMGLSSGGPYAVACASLLAGRVTGAAVVAGVTDMGWTGAWDAYDEAEATLMRFGDDERALTWCQDRYGPNGERFFDDTGEMAPADLALLEDEAVVAGLFPTFAEAFRPGIAGFAHDITVQGRPWSFDPGAITAPTRVFHGEADTIVPVAHGRHTAAVIPDATLQTFPDDGHVSMIARMPEFVAAFTPQ
jgi:pimeloyl-ACP methyl ester carboxylesterase